MNPIKSISRRAVRFLASRRLLSPRRAAMALYRIAFGRRPDMHSPRDINEKVLWLEFNTDTSRWSELADKVAVHDFVRQRGLAHILTPIYGVWNSADEIDFDTLPDSFVLKATDGSAQCVFVRDKRREDLDALRRRAASWADSKFGFAGAEPHYARIPHRIFAEQILPVPEGKLPVDYKFFCADGRPYALNVSTERDPRTFVCMRELYSLPDYTPLRGAVVPHLSSRTPHPRPRNLELMMEYAAKLSAGFPFVRVDLYSIGDEIRFGEMTFTPDAGRCLYCTPEGLRILGEPITLPGL